MVIPSSCRHSFVALVLFAHISLLSLSQSIAQELQPEKGSEARHFTLKVLPLLKEKCLGCHGNAPQDLKGEFDIRSLASILKGGESEEPGLVVGKPAESVLYKAVTWEELEMPPKENDRLTPEQCAMIARWIQAGAPWPSEEQQDEIRRAEWNVPENEDGLLVNTSGGLSDEWTYRRYAPEDIWAFQPLADEFPHDSIDAFIDAKLNQAGLESAEEASPDILVRRAYYDLTGLPPTPFQKSQFVKSYVEDPETAWSDLTEKLLKSKHYGERWGQHWLDVVRYADTAGFSNDYERSNAWRYRDYVIRSFNQDKPFNQFIREQLAGDEITPQTAEGIIATGFLRMGPWGTAMIPQPEARQIYLDDLVHNVGQSFLSLPMRCCKCHDHKFDPIPTRDYYRLYSVFAGTQPAEVTAPFLPEENQNYFDNNKEQVEELLAYARAELKVIDDKQENAAREWYKEHDLPYKNENDRKKDPEDMKPPRHVGLNPEEKGIKKVREQDVWIWERRLQRFQPMAQSVYNGPDKKFVNSRKLRIDPKANMDWRPKNKILGGGALEAPLEDVGPGVLSGTGLPVSGEDNFEVTDTLSGRRTDLANWIANDANPLTARSIVNRVWQHHFGTGIVKTANNFGAKGSKPSHPALLDWLTRDFIKHGWKIKRLHRQIMASAAYKRSGRIANPKLQDEKDSDNRLLASYTPRRLTAEELRDSILLVTGELNSEAGGLPARPEINQEVALQPRMIQFSIAPAHQPSRTPQERNRRTIYTYRVRGQADPFLEVMNLPNPNESCELRQGSSVTPQAFTLLNSDVMTDRALAFSLRVQKEFPNKPDRWIPRALRLAFGRAATKSELKRLSEYLAEMEAYHAENEPSKVEYPTQVVRSLVEEFTGEPFEFVEKLNAYDDYQPDAKPWTTSAETRALADVCLLLLNSNEFIYVY